MTGVSRVKLFVTVTLKRLLALQLEGGETAVRSSSPSLLSSEWLTAAHDTTGVLVPMTPMSLARVMVIAHASRL
jgi:hypothetical protein